MAKPELTLDKELLDIPGYLEEVMARLELIQETTGLLRMARASRFFADGYGSNEPPFTLYFSDFTSNQ